MQKIKRTEVQTIQVRTIKRTEVQYKTMAKLWGKRNKKTFFGASKQQQSSDDKSSAVSSSSDSSEKQQTPETNKKKKKGKERGPSRATTSFPKAVTKEYTPPLKSIGEHLEEQHNEVHLVTPETPETEVPSSPNILQMVSVVDTADESVEAVVESSSTKSEEHAVTEPSVLLDKIHVFGKTAESMEVVVATEKLTSHDDIRKKLFPEEEKEEEEEEKTEKDHEKMDEADGKVQEVKQEVVDNKATTEPSTPEETPFDQAAEYKGDEDPAILDLIHESDSVSANNSIMMAPDTKHFKSNVRDALITKKLFELMQCNIDTTEEQKCKCGMDMFYDTVCAAGKGKRPFFNKEFTRDFLEVSGRGIVFL